MRERGTKPRGDNPRGDGDENPPESLAGMMLLSHPVLKDRNFKRTVVLLAVHNPKDGAMGVIINRPLGRTLGEANDTFAGTPLADIPLYEGGPVETDRVIFAGWRRERGQLRFRLHFGIEKEFAEKLREEDPQVELRGFLGYAGWEKAQLEGELKNDAWAVSKVDADLLESEDGVSLWRAMIAGTSPDLRLLSESPEEPENN